MNTLMDPAISALTYRVSQTERKIEELQALLAQANTNIAAMGHELAMARAGVRARAGQIANGIIPAFLDEKDIAVPNELRISRPKVKRGGRLTGGGNREATIVARRWAMWKAQLTMGYTVKQIAQAWGCCRTTIENAKERNFEANGA
jgi:hypothetical protein